MNQFQSKINHKTHQFTKQFTSSELTNRNPAKDELVLENLFTNVDFQKEAKDRFGNLHPHYAEPIRKGFEAIQDYIELHTSDIINTIREIDFLCIKTADRKIQNYEKCFLQNNQKIHKGIFVPIVNSSAFLYKISNQCLLKGNNIDICSNLISDHTNFMFKTAVERINRIAQPLRERVPAQFQLPKMPTRALNNEIMDLKKEENLNKEQNV